MIMAATRTLQLAVSDFALPSPRVGSIETYSGYGSLPDVGQDIHIAIQADRLRHHPTYVAEKWIGHTFTREKHKFVISGRIDGYIPGLPPLIEEIKSAYNVENLIQALERHPEHPYRLQLLTYMYFQFLQTGVAPEGRLHLVCARTGESHNLNVQLEMKSFSEWFERRTLELIAEDEMFEKLKKRRKKSAESFQFPFSDPRPGQKELMTTVEKNLVKNARVLVQAPTGLGKTAAITLPVLQEAMSRGQKTIYTTAKNSQHGVAEDAAKRLQSTGAKVKAVTVHAKSKMCFKDETFCNPEYCEFARDYYTKVSEHGLVEKLAKKKNLSSRTFKKVAREYEVCPFELQLDTVARADLVICDYNYVFSPRNILSRLTANGFGKAGLPNLIVDEAHNLPTRANDYFSAKLSSDELEDLYFKADYLSFDLRVSMQSLVHLIVRRISDLLPGESSPQPCEIKLDFMDFSDVLGKSQELLAKYLSETQELRSQDPVLAFCNLIHTFGESLANLSEEFFSTFTPSPRGGILKITCCDASKSLRESYNGFASTTLFSATVKPFDYYARLLGVDGDDLITAEFGSPFPRENRKLLVIPQVSTRLRDRALNYEKIKSAIERVVNIRPGNYFVFFPSFDFLYQLASRLNLPDFDVVAQRREMGREAVNEVLEKLRAREKPTLILAVQGGVFAEGVDYPGEMLIGAIVVGPALPTFDFERELLRRYFDEKHEGHGFDYAYTYPAMAKVIQSAGRVIRSSEDRGIIVLMDRRFMHESYLKTMPADWLSQGPEGLVSQQILSDIEEFWKSDGT
jgi:DNA excision repair protein ERCC-2